MTRTTHPYRRTAVAVLAIAALGLAACSSDKKATSTSPAGTPGATTAGSTTAAPGETVAPGITAAGTQTTPQTTPGGGPVYPLTGMPVTDNAAASRPALVVKIDNHPQARPQTGLNEADIVFEENVEGITRFAAVFQSQGSDPVGPIRSGRTQDVLLLGSLNHPLFAWSGGNAIVTQTIEGSDFVDLSAQKSNVYKQGKFFRSDRQAPHNLYASTSALWTLAPSGAAPPKQQFTYRETGAAASGIPSPGVDIVMDGGLHVGWTFDSGTGNYLRTQDGKVHADVANGQINSANIVVMIVDYKTSAADTHSPEAQTIGSGDVLVFTGGVLVRGTWTRHDRLSPILLKDANGKVISLTPGRTWVELARVGSATAR